MIEYAIFLHGLAQQWGGCNRNEIVHKGSLGIEDHAHSACVCRESARYHTYDEKDNLRHGIDSG